jgi:large subunit ribosomal protein L19
MQQTIRKVEDNYRKKQVVDVRSGDIVRVHQKIKEGEKERVQVFEGFVIRTDRKNSLTSRITVRRISGGVGVEKSFLLHSPLITKVEVVKRSKVRRKNLTYMRDRSGKSARLAGVDFDKDSVNTIDELIDAEVGEVKEPEQTDVSKKEEREDVVEKEEIKAEKTAVEAKTEEKSEHPETESPKEKEAKEEPVESKKDEDSSAIDTKEDKKLSKKEKAEAFRKAQEEKKKK